MRTTKPPVKKGLEQAGVAPETKGSKTRRQVGATIDKRLWRLLRRQAFTEGRTAAQLLDDAIRLYLEGRPEPSEQEASQ